jgi:acid phosphatase (class A)
MRALMRQGFAGALIVALVLGLQSASAQDVGGWITLVGVERVVLPPPARGSRIEQNEIAEIYQAQRLATPAAQALAKHDNDVENSTIFSDTIGPRWDLSMLPKTKFLMQKVMAVDRSASSASKNYFHRPRPWIVDSKIQTCAGHESGPALNSYPSGHAMLGYELGVVLAALIPEKAQLIRARAKLYGENRILCGFHFRSDVMAGQQYGTALAGQMLQNPQFHAWFLEARSELIAAGMTHQ